LPQKRHAQSLIGKTHIHDRSRMAFGQQSDTATGAVSVKD
jgi:hypothetical protein